MGYLIAAYAIVGVSLAGYALYLARRRARLAKRRTQH
jgi:CcmD family protein